MDQLNSRGHTRACTCCFECRSENRRWALSLPAALMLNPALKTNRSILIKRNRLIYDGLRGKENGRRKK